MCTWKLQEQKPLEADNEEVVKFSNVSFQQWES